METIKDLINEYRTTKIEFSEQPQMLCFILFKKIVSRIFDLVDKDLIVVDDNEKERNEVTVVLPLVIDENDQDENDYDITRYYKLLDLIRSESGFQYKGHPMVLQLREFEWEECRGQGEGHIKEIRTVDDYIDLYESLDRMRFWDDNYNPEYY